MASLDAAGGWAWVAFQGVTACQGVGEAFRGGRAPREVSLNASAAEKASLMPGPVAEFVVAAGVLGSMGVAAMGQMGHLEGAVLARQVTVGLAVVLGMFGEGEGWASPAVQLQAEGGLQDGQGEGGEAW